MRLGKSEKSFKVEVATTIIPVVKVQLNEIDYGDIFKWEESWDYDAIDPRTPIILDRGKYLIGGHLQYLSAKESREEYIKAVYLDSLYDTKISAQTLEQQFLDKNISMSFAYSLYASVHDNRDVVLFPNFCYYFYPKIENFNIEKRIKDYIDSLNVYFGGVRYVK